MPAFSVGELSAIYLRGVDLDTNLKPFTKEYRHKTIKYLFRSWLDLENRVPAKVSEGECKERANRYHAAFSETLFNNTVDNRTTFRAIIERLSRRE